MADDERFNVAAMSFSICQHGAAHTGDEPGDFLKPPETVFTRHHRLEHFEVMVFSFEPGKVSLGEKVELPIAGQVAAIWVLSGLACIEFGSHVSEQLIRPNPTARSANVARGKPLKPVQKRVGKGRVFAGAIGSNLSRAARCDGLNR